MDATQQGTLFKQDEWLTAEDIKELIESLQIYKMLGDDNEPINAKQ